MESKTAVGGVAVSPVEENWLFSRLPEEVADTLTVEQRHAIHQIVATSSLGRPPVNIRFSFPLAKWRLYLAVIAGSERRNDSRRARDRSHHPLQTLGNFFFALGVAMLFYLSIFFALALHSSIIEF
jgi:hypothetical protein